VHDASDPTAVLPKDTVVAGPELAWSQTDGDGRDLKSDPTTATQWVSVAEDGKRREMTMIDRRTTTERYTAVDDDEIRAGRGVRVVM
jgi:hypothetical protein